MYREIYLKILVALLSFEVGVRCDWVEIPFLQPSTTTQRAPVVIRRTQIDQPSSGDIISHVLPSVVRGDTFKGGISDLVDYGEFSQDSGANTSEKYFHFHKRFYEFPRANVSNKMGWFPDTKEHGFVTDLVDRNQSPSEHMVDHAPMSNKYEEESIEYLNTEEPRPALSIGDRVDLPEHEESDETNYETDVDTSEEDPNSSEQPSAAIGVNHYSDFDVYDAEASQPQRDPDWQYENISTIKRKTRPGNDGVTIVRVSPSRRRHRPETASPVDESGFVGFMKFLKRMQDGFLVRTARTIGDKIKVLQDLKNQLLLSIAKRMSFLWAQPPIPEDGSRRDARRLRVKRGGTSGWMDHPSDHGGMEFPSAEAALLTISFLTFAVFLIKLVLQVINTIKAKHYTYNTLMGMSGVNTGTLKIVKRNKRSIVDDDDWKQDLDILDAINSYSYA